MGQSIYWQNGIEKGSDVISKHLIQGLLIYTKHGNLLRSFIFGIGSAFGNPEMKEASIFRINDFAISPNVSTENFLYREICILNLHKQSSFPGKMPLANHKTMMYNKLRKKSIL